MTRDDVIKYIAEQYGIENEFLWEGDTTTCVFRHPSHKWFGALMVVSGTKIGLQSDAPVDILDVKLDPELIQELLATKAGQVFPAYHMNKRHWITILLAETTESQLVEALINDSFALTL